MATYKTPDVYVEEISIFPPSVAEVETAIPAFIGYTEKADEFGPGDLRYVPTKVTSLLEYGALFGGTPPVSIEEVVLDENSVVSDYKVTSNFYMYDSLRLFFMNGGGKCYIISIGSYNDTVTRSHFIDKGVANLKKQDEPTIILFPDAVLLNDDLYFVQQAALVQCAELMDRFAVFDLLESKNGNPNFGWEDGKGEFRKQIGINNLKYGAAYTPWLKTNLGIDVHYRDVQGKIFRGGKVINIDVLVVSDEIKIIVTNLNSAIKNKERIEDDIDTVKGAGEATLKSKYISLLDDLRSDPKADTFKPIFQFIYDIIEKIDTWTGGSDPIEKTEDNNLFGDINDSITDPLNASMETLIAYDKGATKAIMGQYDLYKNIVIAHDIWSNIFTSNHDDAPIADDSIYTGATNAEKIIAAEPKITLIFNQVNAAVTNMVKSAHTYEATFDKSLFDSCPVYKNIITKLNGALTKLPPSGAIAGAYAMIDNNRGVWKAPANVSLNSVVGVTETIDNEDQKDLNVDVVAGKSINAIRTFTGKGTLVWGARTLAGNDNEWRYISVRRFFNMVEESVKKSTYWAVFEPNDANTWLKVKSMIENYLIQKWRDGALAGAKADEAFFVKVGLGITMTQQDILEGRMNIEIGMAVVRPAEFIILKFSHKMQES